jgi:tetratricopeptide (TPR) repeat protein
MDLAAPPSQAIEAYVEAERCYSDLLRANPQDGEARVGLAHSVASEGAMLAQMGQNDLARKRLHLARTHFDDYFALASHTPADPVLHRYARWQCYSIASALAKLEDRTGNKAASIESIEAAQGLAEGILQELKGQAAERINFASLAADVGELVRFHRPDVARSVLQQACEIYSTATPGQPFDPDLTRKAARAHYLLAGVEDHADRPNEALRNHQTAVRLFELLAERDPGDFRILSHLANAYHVMARIHADNGRPELAPELYRKAIALQTRICEIRPADSRDFGGRAGTWHRLGEALAKLDRRPEAVEAFRHALECLRHMSARDMGSIEFRRLWIERSGWLIQALCQIHQASEALVVARDLLARFPTDSGVGACVAADLTWASIAALVQKSFHLLTALRNR